jgi:GntR family transcriptional repressor for pyruvate dehydrogenase complex
LYRAPLLPAVGGFSAALASLAPKAPDRRSQVANELIAMIRTEGFAVGDRLPSIRQIAGSLKVSKTLARDAMIQVQAMGLIKLHSRSGAFVRSLEAKPLVPPDGAAFALVKSADQNLLYLLDARRVIEQEVAVQAAQRRRLEDLLPVRQTLEQLDCAAAENRHYEFIEADAQFHMALAGVAGNSVLIALVQSLAVCMKPLLLKFVSTPQQLQSVQVSHKAIYEAVLAADGASAASAMQRHFEASGFEF